MSGELIPETKPVKVSQLSRHENGLDVIDTYKIYKSEFAVRSVYVSSIYAKDLDLSFMEITDSSFVPPRALPYPMDQITLH